MIHTLLDSLAQCETLLQTRNYHQYLSALQHGAHTDGESHPRHRIDVIIEKAGIGEDCIVCESFDTGARSQG